MTTTWTPGSDGRMLRKGNVLRLRRRWQHTGNFKGETRNRSRRGGELRRKREKRAGGQMWRKMYQEMIVPPQIKGKR